MNILIGMPFKMNEKEFKIVTFDEDRYILDEESKWAVCTERDGEIILREAEIFTQNRISDIFEEVALAFVADDQHVKLWTYASLYSNTLRSK